MTPYTRRILDTSKTSYTNVTSHVHWLREREKEGKRQQRALTRELLTGDRRGDHAGKMISRSRNVTRTRNKAAIRLGQKFHVCMCMCVRVRACVRRVSRH